MPCYDSRRDDRSEEYAKIELLTRVACELSRVVRRNPFILSALSVETRNWMASHAEADARHEKEKR